MIKFLVFDTLEEAEIKLDEVNIAMGLNGNITSTWAEIKQRLDGKYVFIQPPINVDISDIVVEEYNLDWFGD
jgi:hypothetical protein